MTKTKRFRLTSRSQTRKRSKQSQMKKTIVFSSHYIPKDQESEIPISSYQPLPLPNDTGIRNPTIQYKISQSETDDTFIATIYRYDETKLEISVGGNHRLPSCVTININSINISDTQTIVEATFNVDYNERCNTSNNLKSALILARVAVTFAFTYFKIDKFILKDHSIFHCKTYSRSDYRFHLYGRELLKYGKTWYQRNLNAHIYHPRTLENIQRYVRFVEMKPSWNVFSQTNDSERLKPIWEKSKSYKELVLTLLEGIQRVHHNSFDNKVVDELTNINCHLLYPWFNQVTNHFLRDLPEVDNFILRDGFPFVKGLNVEFIPDNEYEETIPSRLQQSGGAGDAAYWFTERIR